MADREAPVPKDAPEAAAALAHAVDAILARCGGEIAVAAPLGLGKPHRLLNALYDRVAADPARRLRIHTALSLDPPTPHAGLETRFLQPFLDRHFGAAFPRLRYTVAQKADALPPNVHVEEFYVQSGAMLGSTQAQSSYNALNYTHVARAVAARGIDLLVQKVAASPDGSRLSLSCNPDLSLDLLDEIARLGKPRPMLVAEVDPHLPFLGGAGDVPRAFFDLVLDLPGPAPALFALPRQPVSDAEFAIGLYASTLVRDGGTLQIGIGSLSDALCHALVLRHTRNADYLAMLEALAPGVDALPLVRERGGTGVFREGLYGASEMVNDGFMRLRQAGILVRRVVDDEPLMARVVGGSASEADRAAVAREGHWLDGGFYLGSKDLYDWLRAMPADEARGLGMTRISHINELYGGHEARERLQRREARFFNTCMMMTALGAAVSDGLDDGRVVSGVGGQYNFVAMAHALQDGRSVLLFRAIREQGGATRSSVVWNYSHCTIPRHLRDVAVTEYGIADLRAVDDGGCVVAMLGLADARFQPALLAKARAARKLPAGFAQPAAWAANTPAEITRRLAPFRASGLLVDYPLGCDFTPVEQRLVRALAWLKSETATRGGKLRTLGRALLPMRRVLGDVPALARMALDAPEGLRARLDARLLRLALLQDDGFNVA
jgi:acyl-CoA hydrolase